MQRFGGISGAELRNGKQSLKVIERIHSSENKSPRHAGIKRLRNKKAERLYQLKNHNRLN